MDNLVLDRAAQAVIEAIDTPKLAKPPLKSERLYIQVVTDAADCWNKRAFLCHDYLDGNLAEIFELRDHSLREVVEFLAEKLGCPVIIE